MLLFYDSAAERLALLFFLLIFFFFTFFFFRNTAIERDGRGRRVMCWRWKGVDDNFKDTKALGFTKEQLHIYTSKEPWDGCCIVCSETCWPGWVHGMGSLFVAFEYPPTGSLLFDDCSFSLSSIIISSYDLLNGFME